MNVFLDVEGLTRGIEFNASRSGIFRATEALFEALDTYTDVNLHCAVFSQLLAIHKLALSGPALSLVEDLPLGSSHFENGIPIYRKRKFFRYEPLYRQIGNATNWKKLIKAAKRLSAEESILHATTLDPSPNKFTSRNTRRFLNFYDLTPILFPSFFDGTQTVEYFTALLRGVREDDFIFTCSESTRNDLLEHLPHLDPQRVFVNYLSASRFFKPVAIRPQTRKWLDSLGVAGREFFLSTSTIEPRKNIPLLTEAFFSWVQQTQNKGVCLVICGAPGWQYNNILAAIRKATPPKYMDQILLVNHVSDEILRELYSACVALVYPSLYEGFGLPVLEAMSCGAPVITSNVSSLPEVVGDAAPLLHPKDSDGFASAMGELFQSSALRRKRSEQSLARARHFSLEQLAHRTVAGYKKAH